MYVIIIQSFLKVSLDALCMKKAFTCVIADATHLLSTWIHVCTYNYSICIIGVYIYGPAHVCNFQKVKYLSFSKDVWSRLLLHHLLCC